MLLEWWSGTECTLYTDQATVDNFGKEHVIIILNHNFEIDFLCGWTMCERFGVLGVSNVAKTQKKKKKAHHLRLKECLQKHICTPFLEFQSASQTRATEGSSDWLDLVLPRNSLLQTKVGGGPKDSLQRADQAQRLS